MEALLLFCCQSCLKGDHDIEYYEILSITPSATSDEIKKAYKKQSLLLHPDRLAQRGIQVTPEHNLKFQQLKEAYDVLSDARKRRLYDKIGKSGLKLIDSPQEINPKDLIKNFQQNKKDRMKLILVIFLIFASILIVPILFSLKCDGKLRNVPWVTIWIPMWVVNSVMVISAILFLIEKDDSSSHGSKKNGNSSGILSEDDEESNDKPEKIPLTIKLTFAIKTFAFVLLQIFIFIRLDHNISWKWFKVFIPWFIYEGFGLVEKFPGAFVTVIQPDYAALDQATEIPDEEKNLQKLMLETEFFRKTLEKYMTRKSLGITLLRIWFAFFLAAQLDDRVDWDWGLVMLPIWCYFLLELLFAYRLRNWGASYLKGIDFEAIERGEHDPMTILRAQHGQELTAAGTIGTCFLFPTVFMAVLLVSRLEAGHFTTFIIILPIFLLLGCCMCGVCCGLCALASVDTNQLDGSETGSDDPSSRMMKADLYTPPPVVVGGEDIESAGQRQDSSEYGTFNPNSYTATSPIILESNLSSPTVTVTTTTAASTSSSTATTKQVRHTEVEVDID